VQKHLSYPRGLTRRDLIDWFRQGRARSREIFAIPKAEAYYDRPIRLRNPIVFYEGHLPAFAVNTLIKRILNKPGIDAKYEILFERGIDPESEDAAKPTSSTWPSRRDVQAYGDEADRLIERALCDGDIECDGGEAAVAILEHEQMHQETLLYMFHEMPYERKNRRPPLGVAAGLTPPDGGLKPSAPHTARIPAGIATLGAGDHFAWDNEIPQHQVEVPAFEVDRCKVTNAEFLEFVNATGAEPSHFWTKNNGEWCWRGMFELVPLPLDAPVYATQEQAAAYAKWRGKRLMTEAEYDRAAYGGGDGQLSGNFGFRSWDPVAGGSHPANAFGVHDLAGNGWEWTATPFAGFDGFRPMNCYPNYSADFFDDQHFVLKGGSPATAPELVRRSFRNWFRGNYPYVYAGFRCAATRPS